MSSAPEDRAKRSRRSGDELRRNLLVAGRELFAEMGYPGASTKEISLRAGVTEVSLFRHFDNKEGLFERAVLEPFEQFITEFSGRSARPWADASLEQVVREYIELLLGYIQENEVLIRALLNARAHLPNLAGRLERLLDALQQLAADAMVEFGLSANNIEISTRLTLGMILASVVHVDVLFPQGERPSHDQMVDALCDYLLNGMGLRHAGDSQT